MLGDLYQNDTDAALDNLSTLPPERPKPVPKWNGWSALPRGVTAAVAEAGGAASDMGKAVSDKLSEVSDEKGSSAFDLLTIPARLGSDVGRGPKEGQFTSEMGTALREVARDYRPDAATASTAERLTFDLSRFVTKAVGYTVTGGALAGATMLGGDEGLTAADDLARQGVDIKTRTQVGALTGATAAAGVLLPVAAPASKLATAGLWAVGGPGAFVAQQAATREILRSANYKELAEAYDPLDPVGLAVSSLVPAGFAAYALHSAARATRAQAAIKPVAGEAPKPAEPAGLTPDQTDAVMTHNLTLAQDVREATTPREAAAILQGPVRGLAADQRIVEQRFTDQMLADVDGTLAAYAAKPETRGGKVVNTDLFRDLSPDYAASKESRSRFAAAVHEPASWLAREHYNRLLAQPPETGSVMILGGGGGSGKSTSLDTVAPGYEAKFDAIYDTTLASLKKSMEAVESALASGRTVLITYTARDPMDALVNGVISRAERDGRTVPLGVAAQAHQDAPKTLAALAEKYASDDRVKIRIVENTRGPGQQRFVAQIPDFSYNDLAGRAYAAADQLYEKSSISKATYDGLVSGRAGEAEAGLPGTESRSPGVSGSDAEVNPGRTAASAEASVTPGGPAATDAAQASPKDHHTKSVLDRAAEIERVNPDMVVGKDAAGNDVTVAQELDRIRRESIEGTDSELGVQDAPLLEVAANCALSTGTA